MNSLMFDSVLGSIKRSPGIALLVILLIALGVGVSVPMLTVKHHLESDPIPGKSQDLYFVQLDNWKKDEPFRRPNDPPNAISYQDASALQKSDIAKYKAPMYLTQSTLSFESKNLKPIKLDTRMTGRDFFSMFDTPFLYGNPWSKDAERNNELVAVISKTLSERLFGEENTIGKQFLLNNRYFTVVGVIDNWNLTPRFYDMNDPFASAEHVFLPYELIFREKIQPDYWRSPAQLEKPLNVDSFEELFSASEIIFVQYWVQLESKELVNQYKAFLNQYVAEQKDFGRFPRDINNRLLSSLEWIKKGSENSKEAGGIKSMIVIMLLFFSICLINSISLLLTKFLRYKNRSSLLRALGASQKFIFAQHLIEVVTLSLLGGGLGVLFAYFGLDAAHSLYAQNTTSGNSGMLAYQSYDMFWTLDSTMIFICLALALFGGLIAGIYPAWRVCKIPPAIELKSI